MSAYYVKMMKKKEKRFSLVGGFGLMANPSGK